MKKVIEEVSSVIQDLKKFLDSGTPGATLRFSLVVACAGIITVVLWKYIFLTIIGVGLLWFVEKTAAYSWLVEKMKTLLLLFVDWVLLGKYTFARRAHISSSDEMARGESSEGNTVGLSQIHGIFKQKGVSTRGNGALDD